MAIKVGYINLQKSTFASANLNKVSARDVELITEPYTHEGSVLLLRARDRTLFQANTHNPRACIWVKNSFNFWLVEEFTSRDICTVAREWKGKVVYLSVAYLDIKSPAKMDTMVSLVRKCNAMQTPLLLCMDSNAHSTLWNCREGNARGEELEDLFFEEGLTVENVGNTPTFSSHVGTSIIDVTTTNTYAYNHFSVENWRVLEDEMLSDHKYINFQFVHGESVPKKLRNWKKGEWGRFQTLTRDTSHLPILKRTSQSLDECALAFETFVRTHLDEVCPLRNTMGRKPIPWWTPDLDRLHKEARMLGERRQHSGRVYELFRMKLNEFRRELKKAKKESWRQFCSDAEGAKELSTVVKILKGKTQKSIGLIRKGDGTYTTKPSESLQELLATHFPNSQELGENEEPPQGMAGRPVDLALLRGIITPEKVRNSIKSFGPMKAAGPDGFKPVVLQNLHDNALKYIVEMYIHAIWLGYSPKCWREMQVVFIPKPGKDDYAHAKSYRPITLSNFILKGLERVIQWHVCDTVLTEPHSGQHAFTKGYSTETALSEAVDFIERSVLRGELVLAVSMDCTGAFDYIKYDSARSSMRKLGIGSDIIRWYENLLRNRRIKADVQGITKHIRPTRGSPQGGVLSPIVWNMIMNTLLEQFKGGAVKAVGYADDILLLVAGLDRRTMTSIMQEALNKVTEWGKVNGLTFNPTKTTVVAFQRGTQKRQWPFLILNDTALEYSTDMKYLGVTLQAAPSGLTWTKHVKEKVAKAMRVLQLTKAIVGQKWGLTPEKVFWVYSALVRPILSYGSIVWSHSINKTLKGRLTRVQSFAIRSMIGVMRSTPTAGMEVVLGLMPLDLYIQSQATSARLRVRLLGRDIWDGVGSRLLGHKRWHDDKLAEAQVLNRELDQMIKKNNWNPRCDTVQDPEIVIYTDGSKEDGRVGAGWAISRGDEIVGEGSLRLNDEATVFQAEVVAIREALVWLNTSKKYKESSVCIWSDSKAAISAILKVTHKSKTTFECANHLAIAQESRLVQLSWIKGHAGNTGNELADMLAKKGNLITSSEGIRIPIPLRYAKSKIEDLYYSQWKRRWNEEPDCGQTRELFPNVNRGKLKTLLRLKRSQLKILVEAATGHGLLAYHVAHWRPDVDPTCKFCLEDDEKFTHLLHECPALWQERLELQGRLETNSSNPIAYEREIIRFFSTDDMKTVFQLNIS